MITRQSDFNLTNHATLAAPMVNPWVDQTPTSGFIDVQPLPGARIGVS